MGLDKAAMLQRGSGWNMFQRPRGMPLVTYGFSLCDAVMWTSRYSSFYMYYVSRNAPQKFIKDVHIMLLCCARPLCHQTWTECDDSTEKQHKARTHQVSCQHFNQASDIQGFHWPRHLGLISASDKCVTLRFS